MSRKRVNRKPSEAAFFRLMDRLVDFVESMPTQPSPVEEKRQAVLAAAEGFGYKQK